MVIGLFDNIAKTYNEAVPPIPKEYKELLLNTFRTKAEDHIIDLGCGSGDLALFFSKKAAFVQGIDASGVMIEEAKKKDSEKKVAWFHNSVDNFDLGKDRYNLIYSYESFHLFSNQRELIQRCAEALKPGGYLAIGWAIYEWDIPLRNAITETFTSFGITRGEWGVWMCPNFSNDVASLDGKLAEPQVKEILIQSKTPIKTIIEFIFSNSKSSDLKDELKPKIASELTKRFFEIYPSGESDGYTTYSLRFTQK